MSRRRRRNINIGVDEIFMDTANLPAFDHARLEGSIEKPISLFAYRFVAFVVSVVFLLFVIKLSSLQIVHGSEYASQSETNRLRQSLVVASRGIIYSRDGEPLAWNEKAEGEEFARRRYSSWSGFSHILGFVKYPAKDKAGFYYQSEYEPKAGIELSENERLRGRNGVRLFESTVDGEVVSSNTIVAPHDGESISITIDSGVQSKLYREIELFAQTYGFRAGAGVIMDIHTGEILAMTSYPEYNSDIMTEGASSTAIAAYYKDPNNPFLDRSYAGSFTPGSIVKPFLAIAALEENIIAPEKIIVSTGSLVIPNPYNPALPSVFRDWRAHGAVDMRRALAVSSDVYFYEITGGFEDQKGLGIYRMNEYLEKVGFGSKTGIGLPSEVSGFLPSPEWKKEKYDDIWRVGDTYITGIGQYATLVTPLQMAVATGIIASDGTKATPTLVLRKSGEITPSTVIHFKPSSLKAVKEGMRLAVTEGTAMPVNLPYIEVSAKTGTVENGAQKQFSHTWAIGYWPSQNPKYSFAVVVERGPASNTVGAPHIIRAVLDYMNTDAREYLGLSESANPSEE